ncbi:hypothetical protein QO002_003302 [Pararhizobium capsulatum DSM 1112]|uniref:DUF1236 domain-containing protein n=1 Tax=Pararhizobium capsulatum DSM 1112 TaxID=1121113 RepID=A0ABU0BSD5_9HYPH|nr:DUF1236 domain-containing protein [Pararhizobium capsulatum]MDQ0321164.1 hypothetical protein [Pararhizobium capsulatum DSM 1112]
MKKTLIAAAAFAALATTAVAQEATVTGMVGGAATGAIVGGPIGAGVGGVIGAVAAATIDPPPARVITYVQQQPVQQSIVVQQPVVIGKPIPRDVVLVPVPEDQRYAYAVVNNQRVIVDPNTHTVVQVLN